MSDYESFDEEEEYDGILKKAFDVELSENFNPNNIPQTGEEYLQHVIYERNNCRTWVTANIDTNKFKNKQTFKIEEETHVKTSSNLLPTKEWQILKLEEFTKFRHFLSWKISEEPSNNSFNEEDFSEKLTEEIPKFSEIIRYTQAAKIRMVQLISKKLKELNNFSSNIGIWIYSILVLLEIPLSPDSCHNLREFCKKCIRIRANSEMLGNLEISGLNLIVCIISRFFKQLDLADPFN